MSKLVLILLIAMAIAASAAPQGYYYPELWNQYQPQYVYGTYPNYVPQYYWNLYPVYNWGGYGQYYQLGKVVDCAATSTLSHVPGMTEWCRANCFSSLNTCPKSHCQCWW